MRVAAGAGLAAPRSIARIGKRVVMALKSPSLAEARVADQGKTRVNRRANALLLAERIGRNQARG
jgi:hypothetical protein